MIRTFLSSAFLVCAALTIGFVNHCGVEVTERGEGDCQPAPILVGDRGEGDYQPAPIMLADRGDGDIQPAPVSPV